MNSKTVTLAEIIDTAHFLGVLQSMAETDGFPQVYEGVISMYETDLRDMIHAFGQDNVRRPY